MAEHEIYGTAKISEILNTHFNEQFYNGIYELKAGQITPHISIYKQIF